MFDFSWSEILILGIVGLIFIGPRDLPKAFQTLAKGIKTLKRMAFEVQSQIEDLAKHADMQEIGGKLRSEWRSLDLRNRIENTLDPDKALKNPLGDLPQLPMTPAPQSSYSTPPAAQQSVSPSSVVQSYSQPVQAENKADLEQERRNAILAECPSCLPPRYALRIYEERKRKMRPACLPPEISIHGEKRVVIARIARD